MIVDDKADIGDRAVPDLVIAFSLSVELAASFAQMLFQDSGVIGHQIPALWAISKRRVMTSKGTS